MEPDLTQERRRAHALLDTLPPAKLCAVCSLLEVMIDEDDEELTDEGRAAIDAGLASLARGEGIPHEEVLREFGLTTADFEKTTASPNQLTERVG